MNHTATYSPEDNKLRIYPACRLAREDYDRVRAAGFIWAPKQEIFVAPMWTPEREDLAIEMCGEIGDEDKSLVERAEERADRFEDYSGSRANDADSARRAVSAIADNIPFGQPILVGHHSEKRARKDAERIENGMRKAVKMWETSQYWQSRAAGAIRAAKYKERSDVRARRVKGLEADKRKREKASAEAAKFSAAWSKVQEVINAGDNEKAQKMALAVANYDHVSAEFPVSHYPRAEGVSKYEGMQSLWSALDGGIIGATKAAEIALHVHNRGISHRARWIAHYSNRIAYEKAMLGESGGIATDRTGPEVGGAVMCLWGPRGGWAYIKKVNKVTVTIWHQWNQGGRVFKHNEPLDKIRDVMTKAQVEEARAAGKIQEAPEGVGFWLMQSRDDFDKAEAKREQAKPEPKTEAAYFEAMKASLKAGVEVVTANQLFPTPAPLAARVATLADIQAGDRVLEPSAGTGSLLGAIGCRMFAEPSTVPYTERDQIHAIEINQKLAGKLQADFPLINVHCADFLEYEPTAFVPFERIVMNPPFENGSDIKHIQHAVKFLSPGGRLVAICANGPRQREKLMPIADEWHDLPAGTFAESGTMVNSALLVINA